MEKQTKRAVKFTNYSEEDFSHGWDSTVYEFAAGESTMLEESLANHFAKHLATRELNKKEIISSSANIKNEMRKAFNGESIEAKDATQLDQAVINENSKKPAKAAKKETKEDLEGFEGK